MYNNHITGISNGTFTGLTRLTELYDPRPCWPVPNLVFASVPPYLTSTLIILASYIRPFLLPVKPHLARYYSVPSYPLTQFNQVPQYLPILPLQPPLARYVSIPF